MLDKLELKDTVGMMQSPDYKERFKAEYHQTKIRYEKLKNFNNRIEAAQEVNVFSRGQAKLQEPKHDCPDALLRSQEHQMSQYLHVLEIRAVIEGIDLADVTVDRGEESCGESRR